MARTVNNVTLVGNLGGDPITRPMDRGGIVANIRVATHRTYKDRNGETQRETEWTPVVCYDRLADSVAAYLTKGRSVYVEGRLRTDQWNDKVTGEPRQRTEVIAREVIFLDRRNEGRVDGTEDVEEDSSELESVLDGDSEEAVVTATAKPKTGKIKL